MNDLAESDVTVQAVRVSYLVSTKNRAPFLAETLTNVREFIGPEDELIIVDGASTDGTTELVAANRDLVTSFVTEPDSGEAHGFNKGIMLSRGKYIKFLTDDDYTFPDAMRQAVALLDANPEIDALICGGEHCFLDSSGAVGSRRAAYLPVGSRLQDNILTLFNKVTCGLGLLLNRRVIPRVGLLDTSFFCVDLEYMARLITSGTVVRYANLNLYRWTYHEHSGCRQTDRVRRDGARVLLRVGAWEPLVQIYPPSDLAEATGLSALRRGEKLAELIVQCDRIRRSPAGFVLTPAALMVQAVMSLAVFARDRFKGPPAQTHMPDPASVDWDGALR